MANQVFPSSILFVSIALAMRVRTRAEKLKVEVIDTSYFTKPNRKQTSSSVQKGIYTEEYSDLDWFNKEEDFY